MQFLLIAFCILFAAAYLWYIVKIFNFLCNWFASYYIKHSTKQHSTEYRLGLWLVMVSIFAVISLVAAVFWIPLMAMSTISEGLRDVEDLDR